jgi:DNA-binding beta-propeller fold protein YncE
VNHGVRPAIGGLGAIRPVARVTEPAAAKADALTRWRLDALEEVLAVLCLYQTRCALAILAAVVSLAGCSAGSTAAPQLPMDSSTVLRAVRPDANFYGNDVYSAQPFGNDLSVYRRKGLSLKLLETLTNGLSGPQGIVTTPSGWLYVANGGDANVLIYRSTRKGPKGPVATLDDSGEVPIDVSITPDRKLVAVSNAASAGSGTGSVSVYVNGASQPSRVLTYGSDRLAGHGVAIDPRGNCFWSFDDVSNPLALGSIVEFARCSGTGTLVRSGITLAGGMVFDQSGNLYYIDEALGIYKCRQTSHCTLFPTSLGLPVNLNFDAQQKHLWVADALGLIYALNPHTGFIELQTISIDGDPYGIAPSPGG